MDNIDTFCAAPWFMIRYQKNDTYAPCCDFQHKLSLYQNEKKMCAKSNSIKKFANQKYMQYVREQLAKGVKIPECSRCWHKEAAGLLSLRQTSNFIVTNKAKNLKNTWLHSFIKSKKKEPFLIAADIKISNKCNFSCVMCNPEDSSKIFSLWNKSKKNNFVQDYLKNDPAYFHSILKTQNKKEAHRVLKEILEHPVKLVKLLGGEPLLEKKMLEILRDLPKEKKKKISLSFCTNGSIDILSTVKKYQLDFNSLTFVVSLEGVGEIQDWARKGSRWIDIEKNIMLAKKAGIHIDIQNTLQASTLPKIVDLYKWCINTKIPLIFCTLEHPKYLSVNVLSDAVKNNVLQSLTKLQQTLDLEKIEFPENSHPDKLYSFLQKLFLPAIKEENEKFYKFIEWYEKDSVLKLKNLVPELYK